ncbi:MAG: hypothetical protein HC772_12810 [Leptolyngbyaceae cyanobacterium CRU_2_3]|nr:hypothetical protein [Leptolyngbyaceae cyanobacterium CRU_2_3]
MSTSKSWTCEGKPKDGKDYPNAFAHQPYENFGPDCAICGLPREAIEVSKGKRPAAAGGSDLAIERVWGWQQGSSQSLS